MTIPIIQNDRQRKLCRCRIFGANYWFLKYKWKENLCGDLVAGVTMAIIQIPQGILKLNYIHVEYFKAILLHNIKRTFV